MAFEKSWLYEACPCGSGKKLKFCCWGEVRDDMGDPMMTHDLFVSAVRRRQAEKHDISALKGDWKNMLKMKEGFGKLRERKFAAAAKCFREVRMARGEIHATWNNEAMALCMGGKLEEAERLLRRCLEWAGETNAFGWALLSEIRHFLGDEEESERYAERAAGIPMPSKDAVDQTALALAWAGLDAAVLACVRGGGYEELAQGHYLAGVAAANLGKRDEALAWLARVPEEVSWAECAERVAEELEAGTWAEDLPGGRWPYFPTSQLMSRNPRLGASLDERKPADGPALCDAVEALLYEGRVDRGGALVLLEGVEGKRAAALRARLEAAGATPSQDPVFSDPARRQKFWMDELLLSKGVAVKNVTLRKNARAEGVLEEDEAAEYNKAVKLLREGRPGGREVAAAVAVFHRLADKYPEAYRIRFNEASALHLLGKTEEAGEIVRRIFEEHPEYGHAAAALIRWAVMAGDWEEAHAVMARYEMPEEVSPEEYLDVMHAQIEFYEERGETKAAKRLEKGCREIEKQFDLPPLKRKFQGIRKMMRELRNARWEGE